MWCVSRGPSHSGFTHKESALSSFLFVVVCDVLRASVRKDELWDLVYADDIGSNDNCEIDVGIKRNEKIQTERIRTKGWHGNHISEETRYQRGKRY